MQVHLRTDNHIEGRERLANYITAVVEDSLSHHLDRVSRVEVHLSDENAGKPGVDDKRCVMEARLDGHKPVAARGRAGSLDEVITETAEKLRRLVGNTLGRLREFRVEEKRT